MIGPPPRSAGRRSADPGPPRLSERRHRNLATGVARPVDLSCSISRIIPSRDIRDGYPRCLERADGNPIRIRCSPSGSATVRWPTVPPWRILFVPRAGSARRTIFRRRSRTAGQRPAVVGQAVGRRGCRGPAWSDLGVAAGRNVREQVVLDLVNRLPLTGCGRSCRPSGSPSLVDLAAVPLPAGIAAGLFFRELLRSLREVPAEDDGENAQTSEPGWLPCSG